MASTFDPKSNSSDSLPSADEAPEIRIQDRPAARGRAVTPQNRSFQTRKRLALLAVVLAGLAVIVAFVLFFSPIFMIEQIVVTQTTRVSNEAVSELAAIPKGSTLFGFDEKGVQARLESSPWIQSVRLVRRIPDTLVVEVHERKTAAIVLLSNGQEAWRISSDGVWIEQISLIEVTADNGFDSYDVQAKKQAQAEGAIYVYGVSATVQAEAGLVCADEALQAVLAYINEFSDDMRSQISSFKAPSREAVAVTLSNGVEVSLGAANDIALKEEIITGLLTQYPGQISYINVRTPAHPTYRGLVEDENLKLGGMVGAPTSDTLPYEANGVGDIAAPVQASTPTSVEAAEQAAAESPTAAYDGMPEDAFFNGGYELYDGTWVNVYYEADGTLVWGYNDGNGEWVSLL